MRHISAKFILAVGLLGAGYAALCFYETWAATAEQARELTAREANLALEFDLAIRHYVAHTVRPMFRQQVGDEEFIPELMSTSFVARSVFERVRKKFPHHVLKFSSDNPRNPANQATPEELEVLQYFRDHPQATRWAGDIRIEGRRYHALFSPQRMKESCLACHDRPEDAPASLVARYGTQGGYDRKVGDVVALDTVAIPLDQDRAAMYRQARERLIRAGLWLAALLGGVFLVFQRVVSRRLAGLTKHVREAAGSVGGGDYQPVDVSGNDEIAVLAGSFNSLFAKVHEARCHLETRVQERTRALSAEVDERERIETSLKEHLQDVERFNRLSVDRELRMVDLKQEVNGLREELGRPARYETNRTDEGTPQVMATSAEPGREEA